MAFSISVCPNVPFSAPGKNFSGYIRGEVFPEKKKKKFFFFPLELVQGQQCPHDARPMHERRVGTR
jgi:hypothetical protein